MNEAAGTYRDEADRVVTQSLGLLAFAGFCGVALLVPDQAMVGRQPTIQIPGIGEATYLTFLCLAPVVIVALWARLHVQAVHADRVRVQLGVGTLGDRQEAIPERHWLLRSLVVVGLYVTTPVILAAFAWKAAPVRRFGPALLLLAVTVILIHAGIVGRRCGLGSRVVNASVGAALLVAWAAVLVYRDRWRGRSISRGQIFRKSIWSRATCAKRRSAVPV